MKEQKGPKASDSDTSESFYESEGPVYRNEEGDLRNWIIYYIDVWKTYWKKRFFRQLIRSSIVFVIGMKLLREIKGLHICHVPAQVPDDLPC